MTASPGRRGELLTVDDAMAVAVAVELVLRLKSAVDVVCMMQSSVTPHFLSLSSNVTLYVAWPSLCPSAMLTSVMIPG